MASLLTSTLSEKSLKQLTGAGVASSVGKRNSGRGIAGGSGAASFSDAMNSVMQGGQVTGSGNIRPVNSPAVSSGTTAAADSGSSSGGAQAAKVSGASDNVPDSSVTTASGDPGTAGSGTSGKKEADKTSGSARERKNGTVSGTMSAGKQVTGSGKSGTETSSSAARSSGSRKKKDDGDDAVATAAAPQDLTGSILASAAAVSGNADPLPVSFQPSGTSDDAASVTAIAGISAVSGASASGGATSGIISDGDTGVTTSVFSGETTSEPVKGAGTDSASLEAANPLAGTSLLSAGAAVSMGNDPDIAALARTVAQGNGTDGSAALMSGSDVSSLSSPAMDMISRASGGSAQPVTAISQVSTGLAGMSAGVSSAAKLQDVMQAATVSAGQSAAALLAAQMTNSANTALSIDTVGKIMAASTESSAENVGGVPSGNVSVTQTVSSSGEDDVAEIAVPGADTAQSASIDTADATGSPLPVTGKAAARPAETQTAGVSATLSGSQIPGAGTSGGTMASTAAWAGVSSEGDASDAITVSTDASGLSAAVSGVMAALADIGSSVSAGDSDSGMNGTGQAGAAQSATGADAAGAVGKATSGQVEMQSADVSAILSGAQIPDVGKSGGTTVSSSEGTGLMSASGGAATDAIALSADTSGSSATVPGAVAAVADTGSSATGASISSMNAAHQPGAGQSAAGTDMTGVKRTSGRAAHRQAETQSADVSALLSGAQVPDAGTSDGTTVVSSSEGTGLTAASGTAATDAVALSADASGSSAAVPEAVAAVADTGSSAAGSLDGSAHAAGRADATRAVAGTESAAASRTDQTPAATTSVEEPSATDRKESRSSDGSSSGRQDEKNGREAIPTAASVVAPVLVAAETSSFQDLTSGFSTGNEDTSGASVSGSATDASAPAVSVARSADGASSVSITVPMSDDQTPVHVTIGQNSDASGLRIHIGTAALTTLNELQSGRHELVNALENAGVSAAGAEISFGLADASGGPSSRGPEQSGTQESGSGYQSFSGDFSGSGGGNGSGSGGSGGGAARAQLASSLPATGLSVQTGDAAYLPSSSFSRSGSVNITA